MSIQVPQQLGIVVRKRDHTAAAIAYLRRLNPLLGSNEDEHLAGFWLAGSPQQADTELSRLDNVYGLRLGEDYVCTSSLEGVSGPMPIWLQEDEDCEGMLSVPGTAGPPRTRPRPEVQKLPVSQAATQELLEWGAAWVRRRNGAEVADQCWPAGGNLNKFLEDCEALTLFADETEGEGSARAWVEAAFPSKPWQIGHPGQTPTGLGECLRAYLLTRSDDALAQLRQRAGEYVYEIQEGGRRGTVDVECINAWWLACFRKQTPSMPDA